MSAKCLGNTKKEKKCSKVTKNGNGYCNLHQHQNEKSLVCKYPFKNKKYNHLNRAELVIFLRKIVKIWEIRTRRNQDMSLERLNSETVSEIKSHVEWYVSSEAENAWNSWNNK